MKMTRNHQLQGDNPQTRLSYAVMIIRFLFLGALHHAFVKTQCEGHYKHRFNPIYLLGAELVDRPQSVQPQSLDRSRARTNTTVYVLPAQ